MVEGGMGQTGNLQENFRKPDPCQKGFQYPVNGYFRSLEFIKKLVTDYSQRESLQIFDGKSMSLCYISPIRFRKVIT